MRRRSASACWRLHQELKIDFPVYALFTKADLIAGFAEYFGNFTECRRRKVWGATFQTEDRKKNMVGEVPAEFDALVRRLTEEVADRLHEEPDPISRIAIFGFPAQFALLKDAGRRLPEPDFRADPLPGERQSARLLFLVRHAGRHADRPGAGRDRPQLRRDGARLAAFRAGQELLPVRPADQGDLRRGRLGLARHERGAPRGDHSLWRAGG